MRIPQPTRHDPAPSVLIATDTGAIAPITAPGFAASLRKPARSAIHAGIRTGGRSPVLMGLGAGHARFSQFSDDLDRPRATFSVRKDPGFAPPSSPDGGGTLHFPAWESCPSGIAASLVAPSPRSTYDACVSCLFCGSSGPMSQEHVFPKWQAELFPDLTEVDYVRAFRPSVGQETRHTFPGKPFQVTVGDFCRECNNGWMSRLEDEAKPILTPMILDEARPLSLLDQDAIARWATKTVLTVGPTNAGGQFASRDLYRAFGKRQEPLPGSLVWVGRYDGQGQFPISFHQHGIVIAREDEPPPDPSGGDPTNALHAAFALGNLALFVFAHELPEGPLATGGSSESRTLIWPVESPRYWPPESSVSESELEVESRRVPGGVAPPLPDTDR